MSKRMLFIYNPYAGKASIKNKLSDILDIFTKAGYEVTVYPTQKSGDAIEQTEQRAHKYDVLGCCGGDGTLDEVVTGMMRREHRIPIGYIPAGTTNDFARSLKIPSNMIKAADNIATGKPFACDIGMFNDNTFVYIAAFGLFTDVSYATDQQMKNVLGHMAYILEGAKRLNAVPSYHFKVTYDDVVIEEEFLYGMVTNSLSVGGFQNITGKNVTLDDGVFEVTLIRKPKNMIELNQTMVALVSGNIDTDTMYCFKTSHVEFEGDGGVAWTLDGEFGGYHKKVIVSNEQRAVEIIVPDE